MPTSRGWLHIHAWAVFFSSISVLVVGLKIWTLTLDEKNNILDVFLRTDASTIGALQERVHPLQIHKIYVA